MAKVDFLAPSKYFHADNQSIDLAGKRTALDFWKWAYSDLMQNTTRGYVAQFIVAWALDVDYEPNDPWRSFDLQTRNGKKIEVKSTAFLQSWFYGEKNRKPLFVIKPALPYSLETGLGKEKLFNADIYVLCYFYWLDRKTADIMNLNQWKFWVFSKREIIEKLDGKKSITVAKLERDGYIPLKASELCDVILRK